MKGAWLSAAKTFGLWLGAWSAIGFVIAIAYGEHGSIVFVYYGVLAGIIGGFLHALVVLFRQAVAARKTAAAALGGNH